MVTFLLLSLSLSQEIKSKIKKQDIENREIHKKKKIWFMKGMPLLSLLVKMNHFCVWELSEKKTNCKYWGFFPPFYPVLAPTGCGCYEKQMTFSEMIATEAESPQHSAS